jgi:hypothetical protein
MRQLVRTLRTAAFAAPTPDLVRKPCKPGGHLLIGYCPGVSDDARVQPSLGGERADPGRLRRSTTRGTWNGKALVRENARSKHCKLNGHNCQLPVFRRIDDPRLGVMARTPRAAPRSSFSNCRFELGKLNSPNQHSPIPFPSARHWPPAWEGLLLGHAEEVIRGDEVGGATGSAAG